MTITNFAVRGLPPTPEIQLALGELLNILTGDNGLGKTLLLDTLFWAISGDWVDRPVYPNGSALAAPQISLSTLNGKTQSVQYQFDLTRYDWPTLSGPDHQDILTLYARADGSFVAWDPHKKHSPVLPALRISTGGQLYIKTVVQLSREQVLDGLSQRDEMDGKERSLCNGLLRDWLSWQYRPDQRLFQALLKAIETLAPPDTPFLGAGTPVRVPNDTREMPTLTFSYGEVPLNLAASGLRRIVSLAYMLVWLWNEHRVASELTKRPPLRHLLVLVDELEAHLHPKWQLTILPALLHVAQALSDQLQVQSVIVTHAPLVLASAEPLWDAARDRLFHLNLQESGEQAGKISLEELPFVVYGDANHWLTSNIFELEAARSIEAKEAIKQATQLQMQTQPSKQKIQQVHNELTRLLSPLDAFWPLWRYFAKQHGVD